MKLKIIVFESVYEATSLEFPYWENDAVFFSINQGAHKENITMEFCLNVYQNLVGGLQHNHQVKDITIFGRVWVSVGFTFSR